METAIYLVDDHSLVRSTMKMFLESFDNFTVLGHSGDGREAVREILALKPEIVMMDITLQDTDGIKLTKEIMEALPDIKIIAVTMHQENAYLLPFLEAGGKGYIHKSCADQELVQAIETVRRGKLYLSEDGFQMVARQYQSPKIKEEKTMDTLSEREQHILGMLAHGYSCREIGQELFLTSSTIDTYKRRIKEKLNLKTRVELMDYAIRHKII